MGFVVRVPRDMLQAQAQALADALEAGVDLRRPRPHRRAPDPSRTVAHGVTVSDILHSGGLRCYLCNKALEGEAVEVEHIIPRCHGGTDDRRNLAPACQPCNGKKGGKIVAFNIATRRPEYRWPS